MNLLPKLACGGLLALYAFTAFLALNPEVSEAYRDFYIDRASDVTMRERDTMPPVQAGQVLPHSTRSIGFVGWSPPETEYRWTCGRTAKLVFRTAPSTLAAWPQMVRLTVFPHERQRLRWSLNGAEPASLILHGPADLCLPLPASSLRHGENVLQFELPDALRPQNGDPRLLAMALRRIEFLHAPGARP